MELRFWLCCRDWLNRTAEYTRRKSSKLLEIMHEYYIERIAFYTHDLSSYYRSANSNLVCQTAEQVAALKDFESLLKSCDSFNRKGSTNTMLSRDLSMQAYNLRTSTSLKNALTATNSDTLAGAVQRRLELVARIRVIHFTIINCARAFPSFAGFNIVPLHIPHKQRSTDINFDVATCEARSMIQNFDFRIPSVLKNNQFLQSVRNDYGKKLIVHAEMQILFHLLRTENADLTPFPYIGISIGPCYSCATVLSNLGMFKTRPSHGRICPHWTLPRRTQTQLKNAMGLHLALARLKQELVRAIHRSPSPKRSLRPESTALLSPARRAVGGHKPKRTIGFTKGYSTGT